MDVNISISSVFLIMAERGGFEPLNAAPCTALHGLVRTQQTKHLSELRLSPDFIGLFLSPIHTENVAQQRKM
jgi:hypothetical protein